MPVKALRGYKDFSKMNLTEIAGEAKPVKAEDTVNPETGDPVVFDAVWNADESVAQEVSIDTSAHQLLEVYAKMTTATNIYMDVSPDGQNWIQGYKTWSGLTEIAEGFMNAFRYVKLRSDAAGTSGTDTITLVLIAK